AGWLIVHIGAEVEYAHSLRRIDAIPRLALEEAMTSHQMDDQPREHELARGWMSDEEITARPFHTCVALREISQQVWTPLDSRPLCPRDQPLTLDQNGPRVGSTFSALHAVRPKLPDPICLRHQGLQPICDL